jgi:prepilin-type processing-associated H-X9-DG protein
MARGWRIPDGSGKYYLGANYYPWTVLASCYARYYNNVTTDTHRNQGCNLLYYDGSANWYRNPYAPIWGLHAATYNTEMTQYFYGNADANSWYWRRVPNL